MRATILQKQQVAEEILKSSRFTYGSDGTGREKQHYLEHHIVLDDGTTLSLGFSEVPDDKAATLLQTSLDLFDELSDVYCDADETGDRSTVFKDMLSKLRCVMSDRAANMKLFNRKLLEFKKDLVGQDAAIEFLYCNAHFLLALSDATERASKSIEVSTGKLGRDNDSAFYRFSSDETVACRIVRLSANVLGPRGDEKNGCRQEWLGHCDTLGKRSMFSSYRTNRFNNLFENAIALLSHKKDILLFLEKRTSHNNQLLKSICLDLHDDKIMSIIAGIALFAVNITCPYWKLMNSSTSYGRFPPHVQSMKAALEKWSSDDFDIFLLQEEAPVFGHAFQHQSQIPYDYLSSRPQCDKDLASSTFKLICLNSIQVLTRQLSDFLEDGVYGGPLPTDLTELLDSCPLTNLTGERLFGDLDYDMTKRRTASTYRRSTISMLKHNQTSFFLDKKSPTQLKVIMSSGRKHGLKLKEKHKEANRRAKEELKAKLLENDRRKKEKELEEIERRAALMTEIIAQGGVCHSKDDLDALMAKPQKMKNLKTQMRFHKYYLNVHTLRLTGNFQTLYAGFCNHLSPRVDQVVEEEIDSDNDSDNEDTGQEEEIMDT